LVNFKFAAVAGTGEWRVTGSSPGCLSAGGRRLHVCRDGGLGQISPEWGMAVSANVSQDGRESVISKNHFVAVETRPSSTKHFENIHVVQVDGVFVGHKRLRTNHEESGP